MRLPRVLMLALLLPALALVACDELFQPEVREVPTYRITGGPLDEQSAKALLEALGVPSGQLTPEDFLTEEGALAYLDEDRFLFLPTIAEGSDFSEEDDEEFALFYFDFQAMGAIGDPPDASAAATAVVEALRGSEMHPEQLVAQGRAQVEVVTGHSQFEMVDGDDVSQFDLFLDSHVDLVTRLQADTGHLPLVGPGASLKVVVDHDGPTFVHFEHWSLEPAGTVAVIPQGDALSACEALFARADATAAGASRRTVLDMRAELIYYAPPFESAATTIYPYYECSGTIQVDAGPHGVEQVRMRPTFVKATAQAPDVFAPPDSEQPPREPDTVIVPAAFGVHDAGTEWVGESDGLSGSKRNAGRFYDTFNAVGNVTASFNWGDHNAWERDFKDPVFGGNDTNWIDNVDVAFYTGHANGNGFTFTSEMDDGFLHRTEARWGNYDLEWLVIAACGPLQTTASGLSWGQRWGPAFHRLHLLMAYANDSYDNESEGRIFARAILGVGESPKRIRHAWVKAATTVQPSSVTWAIMGVANSNGMVNWNDYFWGRGTGGGPDIPNDQITFRWRLSGPS